MNVVIYVMDALRADRLGCYGFGKPTSPNLDTFALDAVKYTNAYSVATWTKPNAAALLTGRHPRALGTMHHMDAIPTVEDNLPSLLSGAGFETVGISANMFVSPEFGFEGFDRFHTLQEDPAVQQRRRRVKEDFAQRFLESRELDELVVPHSEDLNERAFEVLSADRDRDTLALLWSIDTHGPYYVRDGEARIDGDPTAFYPESEVDESNLDAVRAIYEEMVRYNDEQFGALVEHLRSEGLYEESLVVVLADHGESLGDRRTVTGRPVVGHNYLVHEELVHVPLLIKYPDGKYAGCVDDRLAQVLDVLPTVGDVLGSADGDDDTDLAERSERVAHGRSIVPERDADPDRSVLVESQPKPTSLYSAAVRRGRFKLLSIERDLQIGRDWKAMVVSILQNLLVEGDRLFDLNRDPDERDDIAESYPETAAELQRLLVETIETYDEQGAGIETDRADIDDATKRRLENLGYQ